MEGKRITASKIIELIKIGMGSQESKEVSVNGGGSSKTGLKEEEEVDATDAVKAIAAVAGVALVGWGLSKLLEGSETQSRKMMKAPGQNYRICRDDFERDPAAWFRDNR